MSTPTDPRREHPSTYFVQDRSNEEELARLQSQDQMLTAGMGGVLPEQLDAPIFRHVLDVGCGTGNWLIETAKAYPSVTQLVGVDISEKMLEYARAQAVAQQVSDRMQFRAMDALRMLEFPDKSFDLVNERLGASFLRTWDWPKLLGEFQRVSRPGGIIRVTECDLTENNSPALTHLYDLFLHAMYNAGHFFTLDRRGVIDELANLLNRHGLQNVQTRIHLLVCRDGTPLWQPYYKNVQHGFRTLLPFFRKWTHVPDDYEVIYQQALSEMQQPDFVATWGLLTAWGNKPGKKLPEQEASVSQDG
jgi:ubiquinone/menaquinone biosynthesis C-methylase UbiE